MPRSRDLPDQSLAYADRADAVLDVHLPDPRVVAEPHGLVFMIHGGFWKAQWDREHTRALARTLADDGWVVATPEYRRVGNGGGWPTTAEDVRAALAFALGPRLDVWSGGAPARTVVTGHSAGGQLTLWLAAQDPSTTPGVDLYLALAPVCDLRAAARLGLGANATQAFLGGEPSEVDYDPADPMTLLAAIPAATGQNPGPAIAVLHGTRDDVVPIELSRGLVAAHPRVRLSVVDSDHFGILVGGIGQMPQNDPAYAEFVALLPIAQQ